MEVKLLEIRDRATFIPVLAVNANSDEPKEEYLLRRCGYPNDQRPNIIITSLDASGRPASNDPYAWGGRTFPVAHNYIIERWNSITTGDVVDVEFILGETLEPKLSERSW